MDRFAKQQEERNAGAEALREKWLPGVPVSVAQKVFDRAWEDGHANGWHEVEMHYQELAPLIEEAWEAGRKHEIDRTNNA